MCLRFLLVNLGTVTSDQTFQFASSTGQEFIHNFWIEWPTKIAIPASPSSVFEISACQFRNCWDLDKALSCPRSIKLCLVQELWILTGKIWNYKNFFYAGGIPIFFNPLFSFTGLLLETSVFFCHLVSHACPCIWHFENSIALLKVIRSVCFPNLPL